MIKILSILVLLLGVISWSYLREKPKVNKESKIETDMNCSESSDSQQEQDIVKVKIGGNMFLNISKKDASTVWKKLLSVGFNSKQTLKLLDELFEYDGEFIYYNELIELLKNNKLSDKVNAKIMNLLIHTYNRQEGIDLMRDPQNEKDKKIQDIIKGQLNNPVGKESLLSALNKLPYIYDSKTTQEILDNELKNRRFGIADTKIYKIKIFSAGVQSDADEFANVIEQIKELPNLQQKELFKEVLRVSQHIAFAREGDVDRSKKIYMEYIKSKMPKTYPKEKKIDPDKIAEEVYVSSGVTQDDIDSIIDEKEKESFINKMSDLLQSRFHAKIDEVSNYKEQKLYRDCLRAIIFASQSYEKDFVDIGKEFYMKSDDVKYKSAVMDTLTEYPIDDDTDSLRYDKDLIENTKNFCMKESLSDEEREFCDYYLNSYFKTEPNK